MTRASLLAAGRQFGQSAAKESKMTESQQATALTILAEIANGRVPPERFRPDAHWWWNGGLDVPVTAFNALLADLHDQMAEGIVVTTGLILSNGDSIAIEATSDGALKNGKHYANRYMFVFHFDGELVREVREYSDSAHVLATFELPGVA